MSPNSKDKYDDMSKSSPHKTIEEALKLPYKTTVVWNIAIGYLIAHLLTIYAVYLTIFEAKYLTGLWATANIIIAGMGITIGSHRLFSHRCFKANAGLRAVLLAFQVLAGQNCAYVWARDHRQHHLYSDTKADPHNSNRGFFFSHIGWLMVRKHPAVIAAGKTMDMSDIEADPLVMFQKNHYKKLYLVIAVLLPVSVPCYFWNETFFNSFLIAFVGRYILQLNTTWLINSAAHKFGTHPYDEKLLPSESGFTSFFTGGEGWHNYHHTFPYDYRASEYGMKWNMNASMIEWFERMGWASDLRSVSKDVVMKKVQNAGDGSHHLWGNRKKIAGESK